MLDTIDWIIARPSVSLAAIIFSYLLFTAFIVPIYFGSKPPLVGRGIYAVSSIAAAMKCRDLVHQGFQMFPNMPFRMQIFPFGVSTVVCGERLVGELRNAPDDALSFGDAITRMMQTDHTLFSNAFPAGTQVEVIRSTLTRNIGAIFPDMFDELKCSFDDIINPNDKEWKPIVVYPTSMQIICRGFNRVVVGLPLCRDEQFREHNMKFATSVLFTGLKINMFPLFLQPLVGRYLSRAKPLVKRMVQFLKPLLDERRNAMKDGGDIPNDFLMWTMEAAAPGIQQTDEGIAMRILQVNFAALHTTTGAFTHALYDLASRPEIVQILREEAERVIGEEGWSKASMQKLVKMDSFLKESARVNGGTFALSRLAKRDFTFSDGTVIPKGTMVAAPLYSIHRNEAVYTNSAEFNPWRFVEKKSTDSEKNAQHGHQYTSTSGDYLQFGFGKHACPGRFFAANEVKAMMSYVLLNYDIKMENEGVRPANIFRGPVTMPDTTVKVMFRSRHN